MYTTKYKLQYINIFLIKMWWKYTYTNSYNLDKYCFIFSIVNIVDSVILLCAYKHMYYVSKTFLKVSTIQLIWHVSNKLIVYTYLLYTFYYKTTILFNDNYYKNKLQTNNLYMYLVLTDITLHFRLNKLNKLTFNYCN